MNSAASSSAPPPYNTSLAPGPTPSPITTAAIDDEKKMELVAAMDPMKLQNIRKVNVSALASFRMAFK